MSQPFAPISLLAPDVEISRALGTAFEATGFAVIVDHGLPAETIKEAWDLTRAFFAQEDAEKRRYHVEGRAGARGYTPYRTEIAKGASVHDLKEFYHIGPPQGAAHGLPANVWPDRPEGFEPTFAVLFEEFERVGVRLLGYIARHLGLDRHWFDGAVDGGNSVLRLLHYPPVAHDAEGAVRAGAHEDINLITLLLGAEESGLEVLTRDGRWLPVEPPEDGLVVNVGDMLQRLTNNVLRSTTHRVVNPEGEAARRSRYAMPFFHHLRNDFLIQSLPGCIATQGKDHYPDALLADDYLDQRLIEIGLK